MSVLLFLVVVIVVLALAIYAVDVAPLPGSQFKGLIKVLLILIAIVVIVQRLGYLNF